MLTIYDNATRIQCFIVRSPREISTVSESHNPRASEPQSLIIPEPQSLKILRLSFKEEHGYTFIDKSFLTMFTGVKILSRVRERTLENSVNKQDLGVKRRA